MLMQSPASWWCRTRGLIGSYHPLLHHQPGVGNTASTYIQEESHLLIGPGKQIPALSSGCKQPTASCLHLHTHDQWKLMFSVCGCTEGATPPQYKGNGVLRTRVKKQAAGGNWDVSKSLSLSSNSLLGIKRTESHEDQSHNFFSRGSCLETRVVLLFPEERHLDDVWISVFKASEHFLRLQDFKV